MRRLTAACSVILTVTLLLTGCGADETPDGGSPPQDKVTYLTAFGAVGRDAFAWVAQEKGWFRDAGIDVTIQLGAATGENLKVLAAGRAQFANLDLTGAWILAGKGEYPDVRAIAAIHQQTLVSIVSLEGGGVTTPKDLEGRQVGAATGSVNQLLFPAYAKLAGIDPTKVTWVNAPPAQLPALLAGGRVDALSTFLIGAKGLSKAAGGKPTVVLPYSQYLPELFGNGLIAPLAITRDNPDLARRFRDAALKGLQYTLEHPEEAAQIMKKAQPAVDVAAAVGEITLMAPYVKPSGVIDRGRVTAAIATLEKSALIPPGLTPDSVVDFALAPAS
ncbi:myristoyl transferase [Actinoplanes cyaneus]|uniref:Thiamine pyrimidine synthase n=1 Tax=Actinoplanes cyaneus TaxID=52696 RepID=A0A919IKS6_9ACTN|nr:ABC transporter substrate-binding protein [Actinoplanes cyaneus]MCW2142083.1 NitT/TauT family transport system substrate-binding protein [Actinoplanes cyaneus]GID63760.1 myristoyl transferase [Actinoplanes cyaneus]